MPARFRSGLTYANVMATVAVFLALGGGAYAAMKLPAHSVGSKQLRNRAVTPKKVARSTIKLFKGRKGDTGPQGVQGLQGLQGLQGIQGPLGPSNAYFKSTATGGTELSLPAGDYVLIGQCDFSNANSSGVFTGLDGLTSSQFGGLGAASATIPDGGSAEASLNAAVRLTSAGTVDNGCTSGSDTSVSVNSLTAIRVGSVTTQ